MCTYFRLASAALLLLLFSLFHPTAVHAQSHTLRGRLADTSGKAIAGCAVSLLDPGDSTMAAFGISDASGTFEIRSVKSGTYLLQAAGIGYAMRYRNVTVPAPQDDLGLIVLRENAMLLQEIEVKGVKVPVLLRGDTVEYNAGAFRVREDAAVEELLRKLPGVQVDNAGNVKAQGKDVRRVLVDGKEFFGNDPKMATKNLPADAIDKVQVFGNRSDAAKFTGIDDGVRNQTINLQMKKEKRNGYFGNVEAGGGTDAHYQSAARLYRFRPERQFAALGMLNNINRFGFSFQDYLSFQGGIQSIAGAGGGAMRLSGDLPIDFGTPVPGLITSGAAGVNYSAETRGGHRLNMSYLGNGADKQEAEERLIRNLSPAGTFITRDDTRSSSRDLGHRLNAGWRTLGDSVSQISLQGSARLTDNRSGRTLSSTAAIDGQLRNSLQSAVADKASGYELEGSGSYIHKTGSTGWPVWQIDGNIRREHIASATDWRNTVSFLLDTAIVTDQQYQRNAQDRTTWKAGGGITRRIREGVYLEPALSVVQDADRLRRSQGASGAERETDSLSGAFSRVWTALQPGLSVRYNTAKVQLSVGLDAEGGMLHSSLEHAPSRESGYRYLKPNFFYRYGTGMASQFNVSFRTDLQQPAARQMLPITNYLNPLQRIRGNEGLRPEYSHTLLANWVRFDQFSGTSMMAQARGVYTKEKISWARSIRPDLSEDLQYVNVAEDYALSAGVEYMTPIRKLGLEATISLDERYNQGLSYVNAQLNVNRTLNHAGRLRLNTRKLKYFDIEAGLGGDITQARASIDPARRTPYYHYNAYSNVLWKPHTRFSVSVNATLDRYTSSGFADAITIPLVNASASWYFLKLNRGVLTLDAFDLMNRNSAVQRVSQLNVLMEQRSNIIRQYVMLSFKYRLSKAGSGEGGVKVRVN